MLKSTVATFHSFAILLALPFLTSCAGTRPLNLNSSTPERIVQRTYEHFERLKTIRGRARVIFESPEMSMTGYARLTIKRPDSVYIKMEAMAGVSVGFFFANGRAFALYSPVDNVAYYGLVQDIDLSRLFHMNVTYRDLVESLSGVVPVWPDSGWTVSIDDGHYVLSRAIRSGTEQVWVDPKNEVVNKWIVTTSSGEIATKREFRRFHKDRGVYVPRIMEFSRPLMRERVTFFFLRQEVNEPLQPSDFAFKIPGSATQIRLEPGDEAILPFWVP